MGHKGPQPHTLAFSPDDELMVILRGPVMRVWDWKKGRLVGEPLIEFGDATSRARFDPTGTRVLVAARRGIFVWDSSKRNEWRHVRLPEAIDPGKQVRVPAGPASVPVHVGLTAVAPDGRTAATELRDGSIALWDIAARKVTRTLPTTRRRSCLGLRFSPDGHHLVAIWRKGVLEIWKL